MQEEEKNQKLRTLSMSQIATQSESLKKKINKDKSEKDQRGFFSKLFSAPDRKQSSIAKSTICSANSRPSSDSSNQNLGTIDEERKSHPTQMEIGFSVNQSQ